MNDDDDDEVIDDIVVDHFFNEVARRRRIPRRTNWRYRYMALSQREVAEATILQVSILEHADFFVLMIFSSISF
jgi:inhibitor of KinA sporulation pathway (predicted exonuclease)